MVDEIIRELGKLLRCEYAHPYTAIAAAQYVVSVYEDAPDWVRLLAGGNPERWDDLFDEVLRWKEVEDAGNHDG